MQGAATMAKRPNNLAAVTIALKILHRIPRKPRSIDGPTLREQLKEDGLIRELRTIERHLESLSDHFGILRDESSKPYRYSWPKESKALDIPVLSEQDSLLLLLAKQQLQSLLPASLNKSMEGFFEQAEYALGAQADSKLAREWLTKVRVVSDSQPLIAPNIDPEIFDVVSNALYSNRWLNLRYRKSSGIVSDIKVMPLGLAQQQQRFYLVCRYEGYDNERTLALHRILSAQSSFTFERPEDFSLMQYDIDGRFAFGEGKKIKLSFRINAIAGAHLLETPLSTDQTVRDVDGKLTITASVIDAARLDWWLRGFGKLITHISKVPLERYQAVVDFVLAKRITSPSVISQKLEIDHSSVIEILEIMASAGILSAVNSKDEREILMSNK